jgi:hypothetical protein
MTMPPPPRPASPDDAFRRPGCACCLGKRSLCLPAETPIFVCPRCDYADNPRMKGCFGPVHPG